jgi:hypothetical protein
MGRRELIAAEHVERVILDADLAAMYGVDVRVLNQDVRRNIGRFPEDFMFRLTPAETAILRSQIVISRSRVGGRFPSSARLRQTLQAIAEIVRRIPGPENRVRRPGPHKLQQEYCSLQQTRRSPRGLPA